MYAIVCTDMLGKTHEVPADQMRLSTAAHGIYRTEKGVLLVKDKLSDQWIIPGGVVDKTEREVDGMRRGILAGSGISIGNDVKLLTIIEEDFYDVYLNQGSHITREFYLIHSIEGGTVMENGNGVYTSRAAYIDDVIWSRFSDKEMNKKYLNILKLAKERILLS